MLNPYNPKESVIASSDAGVQDLVNDIVDLMLRHFNFDTGVTVFPAAEAGFKLYAGSFAIPLTQDVWDLFERSILPRAKVKLEANDFDYSIAFVTNIFGSRMINYGPDPHCSKRVDFS